MSSHPAVKINTAHQLDVPFAEFRNSTFRTILALSGGACLVWQVLVFAIRPEQLIGYNGVIFLLVVVVNGAAIWLLDRHAYGSMLIWGVGVATIIVLSAVAYEFPVARTLYSLVPLTTAILFGWPATLLVVGFSAGMLLPLGRAFPDLLVPNEHLLIVLVSGAAGGLIGGVIRHGLLETIQTYYESYEHAQAGIEEARQQRLELKQSQEDLILANRELTRLTKQLEVLHQVADEARRAKEDFVAAVSHELRTPLNMIIGFIEVIVESPQMYGIQLPATLLADVASIQRNSQHLLELVNDVLDLSQIDTGSMAIARDWCGLKSIVAEALEVIRPLFASKRLYLESDLPEDELKIYCDGTRIREVIINLLSNAGRFTEKGGVRLKAIRHDNNLVVAVQDTGPGIPVENQKRLFEPFQQVDSSMRRRHGGSGLGLAISKRFVEMHGGQMWLESRVAVGTTVYFSLPLSPVEPSFAKDAGATRWFSPYDAYVPRTRRFQAPHAEPIPRCVVLEEGNTVRRLLERYLGEAEVVAVTDTQQAVYELNQSPTQLLVINHRQAGELLNQVGSLSQLPLRIPIVAFWIPGGQDLADDLGVFRYLIKPVTKDMLLGTLAKLGDDIKSILLVDDSAEVLQLFGRILNSMQKGYRIWRASDGEQALEMLRRHKPDVMILDLIMPDMSGFQVLKAKESDASIKSIPVIMITAQDPSGVPKVSDTVSLAREGGFSTRDLLDLIRFLGLNADFRPEHS